MKPFLKYAGGKYRSIHDIANMLPKGDCLIEPFAGSGAVFLNTDYESYIVADINKDLINTYQQLQQYGQLFIDNCHALFSNTYNVKEKYLDLRDEFNTTNDDYRKAIIFVYMNRHGYNGLCRYNKNGKFNVPFGYYLHPYFPEAEMRNFYERAKRAKFICGDFVAVLNLAMPSDVVYCDPPYLPHDGERGFTNYYQNNFDIKEHIKLATTVETLAKNGVPVVISNNDTARTRELYQNATQIQGLNVQKSISCKGSSRKKTSEILALFS